MLQASIAFFIIAIVAYIFGVNGVAGMSMEVGKLLLGVFIILAIISTIVGLFRRGSTP